MRAVASLCGLYSGIYLTTEEKARENLSQGSRRVPDGTMKMHKHTKRIYRHNNKNTKITVLNRNTTIYTYLLTPRCRVLLEKLTGLQLDKKFPAFHGTRRFITALTSVRHLSLSWASPTQSIYPHPTSWRSILILSTHLRLGLPSGLLPSGFLIKTLYTPSPHPYAPIPVQTHKYLNI